jgi:hypothetical protein
MSVDISKLRALLEAATPRPWRHEPSAAENNRAAYVEGVNGRNVASTDTFYDCSILDMSNADAALICAAVNALPGLLDEVERLRARLNPTIEQHDANPAQYWADREVRTDENGFRVPTLADCDWPKHHLRIALADVARMRPVYEAARAFVDDVQATRYVERGVDKLYDTLLAAVDRSRT